MSRSEGDGGLLDAEVERAVRETETEREKFC